MMMMMMMKSKLLVVLLLCNFLFLESANAFVAPVPMTLRASKRAAFTTTTLVQNWFKGRGNEKNDDETQHNNNKTKKKQVVVIGNGMVGQRFLENMLKIDPNQEQCQLTTFCEEPRAAYNRVKLTSFFETRDPSSLSLTSDFDSEGKTAWYDENGIRLLLKDKATSIDTQAKIITGESGTTVPYDACILATGSAPFVPKIPGTQRPGVFVYRTIDDLQKIIAYAEDDANNVKSAAIIGGGLLGLEAAKACQDLGLDEVHIAEYAPTLMARQIDEGGSKMLVDKIEALGLKVHCGAHTQALVGTDGSTDTESMKPVSALKFSNEGWEDIPVQMVIVSCGITPRDELARTALPQDSIEIGARGGVVVDNYLRTTAPGVYAMGEIALHNGMIYGLVGPGYTMAHVGADVVANDLGIVQQPALPSSSSGDKTTKKETLPSFQGQDMPTLLKLLGVDVCSFGIKEAPPGDTDVSEPLVWNDPVTGVYRKLMLNKEGNRLRGAVVVGDKTDFYDLLALKEGNKEVSPLSILPPVAARVDDKAREASAGENPNERICHCNQVSRGQIMQAVAELGVEKATLANVKHYSNAGTGCGGCDQQVKDIIQLELEKQGAAKPNFMCEHFSYSRPELMAKLRMEPDLSSVDTFDKILAKFGNGGDGCEVCKPAVASILQVLDNKVSLDDGRDALQDTNDRALANMQRGGSYSIIPRTPGGELQPDQLIKMGIVAKKYNLYTKITGAQRVGIFGAARHELPEIWEELESVGLESGTAFGKGLRAVKSCVGSAWCRFGLQDSTSLAIRLENRYKGIRTPHKMKGGVAACVRDCAEARGKDFGLVATKEGFNLYLGGNSGANPKHAELFATDIDEETVVKYLDRYIMYYILTADKVERMATWQQKLPATKTGGGPIEHLKEVIIEDSLGICDELDRRMETLVQTYHDDWEDIVKDPERRAKFKQFVNTDKTIAKDEMIEFVDVRGQKRPADWPKDGEPQTNWHAPPGDIFAKSAKSWVKVGMVSDFPPNAGSQILVGDTQLAVFNNEQRGEWYCTQNMCPHKQAFVLSQGIMGDTHGVVKIACPLHKKKFALINGQELDGGDLQLLTFPVRITNEDEVLVKLPAIPELDAILGTHGLRVQQTTCTDVAGDAEELPGPPPRLVPTKPSEVVFI